MAHHLFELRGLGKAYGGVHALNWADDAVLAVRTGDVLGLAGENGAGKSTLLGAITGSVRLDRGSMQFEGADFLPDGPFDALARGMALIPQETLLSPTLTVAENVLLGREREYTRAGAILGRRRNRLARAALDEVGLDLRLDQTVSGMPIEHRKMIELARALAAEPRVLLVDETSNVLSRDGAILLFDKIQEFARSRGAVFFVTHRLDEIMAHCTRVAILKDGVLVAQQVVAETDAGRISHAMVGRDLGVLAIREGRSQDEPLPEPAFVVRDLTAAGCEPLDLDVWPGEIVGIGGLVGCGADAVIRALSGCDPAGVRVLKVNGRGVRSDTLRGRLAAGIAYVPKDRDDEGLLLGASVYDNLMLGSLDHYVHAGFVMPAAGRDSVRSMIRELSIKTPSDGEMVRTLSGGNRQKVLLARWLMRDVPVLLLNNPTRGVDVGAKNEIYDLLDQARSRGKAVVIVSDELPELRRLADRVLIMRSGVVTATYRAPAPAEQELIGVML